VQCKTCKGLVIVRIFGLVSVSMLVVATTAVAQENSFNVGIGAGVAPDYVGSDDYRFVPVPSFELRHEGFGLKTSKAGLEADLVPMLGVDAGPIVRYDMGRKNVRDDVVDLLPDVDGTVEIGAYLGAGLPLTDPTLGDPSLLIGRVEVMQGVSGGHDGITIEGTVGVLHPIGEDMTAVAFVSGTYMSDAYSDAFFGIDAAGSAASGLAAHEADAGLRDVGVGLVLSYDFSEQLSGSLIGNYSRLMGDAAKSPIVDDRGDVNQFFLAAGLSYKLY
jgi:MipA family protein